MGTKNYNLNKPTVGGSLNAWGQPLNDNFDTIDDTLFDNSLPTYASAAARDLAIPNPKPDQRIRRSDLGIIERFDLATNQWLPEAFTRTIGPVVGSKTVGCKADGVANDGLILDATGAFGLAIATVGTGELDVGVHKVATNTTIPGHIKPLRGSWVKPTNGVIVTFSGTVEEVPFAWIDLSLGGKVKLTGPTKDIPAESFKTITVTLPAPALAPSIVSHTNYGAYGGQVAGNEYEIGYLVKGHSGLTQCSPTVKFTMPTPAAAFAVVADPRGDHAGVAFVPVGVNRTTTPGAATTDLKYLGGSQDGLSQYFAQYGLCDRDLFGGHDCGWQMVNNAPGANNALDAQGNAIPNPARGPEVVGFAHIPAGTYLAKYTRVATDGTETAPSPASAAVVHAGPQGILLIKLPYGGATEYSIPSGTVAHNFYLSNDGGATWHRACRTITFTGDHVSTKNYLQNAPLHIVTAQVGYWDGAAAGPAGGGAAQSEVSGLQLALDCCHDSGGGRRVRLSTPQYQVKCPLILRHQPELALTTPIGQALIGGSAHLGSTNNAVSSIQYVGAATNIDFMVYEWNGGRIEHLSFEDPNSRVKWCQGFRDAFGGQAFQGRFKNVNLVANAFDGEAVYVNSECSYGMDSNGHTASEMYYCECSVWGRAWAFSIGSAQTADFRVTDSQVGSLGNNNRYGDGQRCALSGNFRWSGWLVTSGINHGTEGQVGYCPRSEGIYFSNNGLGALHATVDYAEIDVQDGMHMFYGCTLRVNDRNLCSIDHADMLNNANVAFYDLYTAAATRFEHRNARRLNNYVYFNDEQASVPATMAHAGADFDFTKFKQDQGLTGTALPAVRVFNGGVAWHWGAHRATLFEMVQAFALATYAAPGAVPGSPADKTVAMTGARVGDRVKVECSLAIPAGFVLTGFVSGNDTVTIRWLQLFGAAASPDGGAGATYTVYVTRSSQLA